MKIGNTGLPECPYIIQGYFCETQVKQLLRSSCKMAINLSATWYRNPRSASFRCAHVCCCCFVKIHSHRICVRVHISDHSCYWYGHFVSLSMRASYKIVAKCFPSLQLIMSKILRKRRNLRDCCSSFFCGAFDQNGIPNSIGRPLSRWNVVIVTILCLHYNTHR
jgi:hypothetical protein